MVFDRVFTGVVLHYACRSVANVLVRIGTRTKRFLVGAATGLRESAGGTSLQMVSRRSADRLVPFYLKECVKGGVCTPPRPLYTYIYQHAHMVTALRKRSQQRDSARDCRLTVTRSHKFRCGNASEHVRTRCPSARGREEETRWQLIISATPWVARRGQREGAIPLPRQPKSAALPSVQPLPAFGCASSVPWTDPITRALTSQPTPKAGRRKRNVFISRHPIAW